MTRKEDYDTTDDAILALEELIAGGNARKIPAMKRLIDDFHALEKMMDKWVGYADYVRIHDADMHQRAKNHAGLRSQVAADNTMVVIDLPTAG